jgi:hypothetical protein
MQNMGLIWAQTHPPYLNFASPLAKSKWDNIQNLAQIEFPKIFKFHRKCAYVDDMHQNFLETMMSEKLKLQY